MTTIRIGNGSKGGTARLSTSRTTGAKSGGCGCGGRKK
jgi:hypothetical protein